jgi:hypothetical protein
MGANPHANGGVLLHLPSLKIRVVNVVDLMKLEPSTEHPQLDLDAMTRGRPGAGQATQGRPAPTARDGALGGAAWCLRGD